MQKKKLINQVLEKELTMFVNVAARQKADCQERPDEFKRHRSAQFSTWSLSTLKSYFNDLIQAEKSGRNLMTLKYARMEGLIPTLNDDPIIEKIIDAQYGWQKEMLERFPFLMRGARAIESSGGTDAYTSFVTYLRGELETYSHETLRLLHEDVKKYKTENRNMSEALYTVLVESYGYQCLEDAESAIRKREQK